MLYNNCGEYYKKTYGEKVYKLPINLPLTCPNRDGKIGYGGCTFCADVGTGFESLENTLSVSEQIRKNKDYIGSRYKAKKFIAYFQNYTNTYMPIDRFKKYMTEAAMEDVIGIDVSTRPDCIEDIHLEILKEIKEKYHKEITIELGLQSANDNTLKLINRGHDVKTFVEAVKKIKAYGFEIIVHMILNLPYDNFEDIIKGAKLLTELHVDGVKLHSLYIPKNSLMAKDYLENKIDLKNVDDYVKKTAYFLGYLDKKIVIHRIVGRAPEKDSLFCNYNISWWKIRDMIENYMIENNIKQGSLL